jgi:hypothetical protein
MNELDQAPASSQGSATDVIEREPAGDQHAGSYDSQARSPRAENPADTDPSYYDGDIQAALAADNTPTRQEAARQDAIGDGHAGPGDDSSPDGDASIEAILREGDDLPDSRTRQQAAADDLAEGASPRSEAGDTARAPREDPAGSHDAGIEAILNEDDHLPDPRTRQQAAQEDADAGTSLANQDGAPGTSGDQQPGLGPDLEGPESGGHDQRVSVVQLEPEDRTLGDTTPSGIGLKPTGEQLKQMENDNPAERRINRFIDKAVEEADDVHDAMGHIGGAFQADFSPEANSPGPGSGHHSYTVHDTPAPPEDPGMNDAIGNVTVVAVVAAVGVRHLLAHRRRKGA